MEKEKKETMNHYRVYFYTDENKMRDVDFYSEEKNIIFAVNALKRHDTTVAKVEKLEGDLTETEKELGLILEGQEMTLQINKLNQFLNILLI